MLGAEQGKICRVNWSMGDALADGSREIWLINGRGADESS